MLVVTLLRPLAKILILPTLIDSNVSSLKSLDLNSSRVLERPTLCHFSLSRAQCQISWLAVAIVITYNAVRFYTTMFNLLWVVKQHSLSPRSQKSDDNPADDVSISQRHQVDPAEI